MYCYHTHDDIVMGSIYQFKDKYIISAENFKGDEAAEASDEKKAEDKETGDNESLLRAILILACLPS